MGALADRALLARTALALTVANGRYWPSIWPLVRAQLRRWERRARAIEDTELRTLALAKLQDERFNAEVAATLATLAPRRRRAHTVEAIVALELLFDYLDGLTERPSADPLRDGEALFGAFRDAVGTGALNGREYFGEQPGDGGYLRELSRATRAALSHLPAAAEVTEAAQRAAALCSQAQVRKHAAASVGAEQLEIWARDAATDTPLQWRELIAGAASSVLAVHALIAAAADPRTTAAEAAELADTYLMIGVLITALDSLIDHAEDLSSGEDGFIGLYEDHGQLTQALLDVAGRTVAKASIVKHGPHHVMTLAGVVAYYTSAPAARTAIARPIAAQLQAQLRPLIIPTLAVMRTWRLAKRVRLALARAGPGSGQAD